MKFRFSFLKKRFILFSPSIYLSLYSSKRYVNVNFSSLHRFPLEICIHCSNMLACHTSRFIVSGWLPMSWHFNVRLSGNSNLKTYYNKPKVLILHHLWPYTLDNPFCKKTKVMIFISISQVFQCSAMQEGRFNIY